MLTSILGAMVLAVMALVVHRINSDATEAGKRSIRSVEITATLDKLQLALRDGDRAGRDLATARNRDRSDAERYENARFQIRLNLAALGPMTGDEPAQSERLSHLAPLINQQFSSGQRNGDSMREEIDGMIASMRDAESDRLRTFRSLQSDASQKSTWIMVGSLALVSVLSLVFWMLLKIEFTARRALEARLIESATTDELTGVANRSDFDHKLVQEWEFRLRYATALTLLLIDVDQQKQHNDEYGHIAGDSILREVARRLASRLKRTELLARSGGDEFAIVVPQYRKEAMVLAEQLREQIGETPFYLQGHDRPISLRVTVSIGLAEASDADSPRELLAAAHAAVDAAKERGRNCVVSFRSDGVTERLHPTTGLSTRRTKTPITIV